MQTITTLRRRTKIHKAAVAAADTTQVYCHDLPGGFAAQSVDVGSEFVQHTLDTYRTSYLVRDEAGKVTLHVHSNRWYVWTPEVAA